MSSSGWSGLLLVSASIGINKCCWAAVSSWKAEQGWEREAAPLPHENHLPNSCSFLKTGGCESERVLRGAHYHSCLARVFLQRP